MPATVRFGVDRLCDDPSLLHGATRVGLVTNDAARLARNVGSRSRVALLGAGVPLVRLFGPEHGLTAVADDGAAVSDGFDAETQLPVISLYGERTRPEAQSLRDLDALLFDIPDVGTRCYTYTWTLYNAMAACAETGTRLVVLDRPNPLGGDLSCAEGPMLDLAHRSFLGEAVIPLRHQVTLGELATLWQHEQFPDASLTVIPCAGWTRAMRWSDCALPWVPTSPAMPEFASAELYPGICLFEATNLSVGRGTDAPFRQIGAPWVDSSVVARCFLQHHVAGVTIDEVSFTPTIAPYAGEVCYGVRLKLTDANAARPVAIGLLLLAAISQTHREHFAWARYPTAANRTGEGHFERLIGRGDVRAVFDAASESIDGWAVRRWTATGDWADRVCAVLRYE